MAILLGPKETLARNTLAAAAIEAATADRIVFRDASGQVISEELRPAFKALWEPFSVVPPEGCATVEVLNGQTPVFECSVPARFERGASVRIQAFVITEDGEG